MKKFILVFFSAILTLSASAVPAMRGIKRVITLDDGSKIEVELRGDEYVHYWQAEDGACYLKDGAHYVLTGHADIAQLAAVRRRLFSGTEVRRSPGRE